MGFLGAKVAWVDGEDLMGLGFISEFMYLLEIIMSHEIDSFYIYDMYIVYTHTYIV